MGMGMGMGARKLKKKKRKEKKRKKKKKKKTKKTSIQPVVDNFGSTGTGPPFSARFFFPFFPLGSHSRDKADVR